MRDINRLRNQRGAAVLEMAIVVLLILYLTFGAMEYGFLFYREHQITNAARSGVRLAVLPYSTLTQVQTYVGTMMTQHGFASGDYTVTVSSGGTTLTDISLDAIGVGDPLQLNISVPYEKAGLKIGLVPTPSTLQASATMAKEGPNATAGS